MTGTEARRGRLARLHTAAVLYFALGLLVWLALGVVTAVWAPELDRALVRLFFVWAFGLAVLSIALRRAPCPRCGATFFASGARSRPFARACLSCGLALRSVPDPD